MLPPTKEQKKRVIEQFRIQYIHMVNREKTEWSQLSRKEKKELDRICESHFNALQW